MEQVMIINSNVLFSELYFTGFMPIARYDFRKKIITSSFEWMNRDQADINSDFKQPIVYTLIYNKRINRIFFYQRSKKNTETRLSGTWSIGVGGHISFAECGKQVILEKEALREILEELKISCSVNLSNIKCLGFLNLDKSLIDKAHFGIAYILIADTDYIYSNPENSSHIKVGEMQSLDYILDSFHNKNVEEWSRIFINYFREHYLSSLKRQV